MSRKAVKLFELTLARCELNKDHVFFALEDMCSEIVVSEEEHDNGGKHFHCYLKLVEKHTIKELRPAVADALFCEATPSSIHLSSLKNAKHWIKYITKEDTLPLSKNVDTSLFHISWKIHSYVTRNETFSRMHPFVRQNLCMSNIIEKVHGDYWDKAAVRTWMREPATLYCEQDVEWVKCLGEAIAARRHVYLFGETGVGKTTAINQFVKSTGVRVAFLPCALDKFEWSQVADSPDVVVAGDAPAEYLTAHRSTILQLCDNSLVSINVKCKPIKQIQFRGTLIIVSNFKPEGDAALLRRFTVIEAKSNAVTKFEPEIKAEVVADDVADVIMIDSDDDEVLCNNNDCIIMEEFESSY